MKKLFVVLLAALMIFALAACQTVSKEVLKDDTHAAWVAHGPYLLADGTQNDWGGKSTEVYEKSSLKAISMADLQTIDADVFNTLSQKEVKYLYTIDVQFGMNDAGWKTDCLIDGKMHKANGSYAFKIAQCNAETEGDAKVYSEEQWIHDPKTANAESLTPKTLFMPPWQEEPDANGFTWAGNPVAIGGAGLYTIVIAQYKNASAAGTPGYGIALIKKEAKEGQAYEEIVKFIPSEHTYGIVGSFAASDWGNAGADIAMTADGENKWTGEVELKANEEAKVRADGKWDNSWGTADGGNFKAEEDGTYVLTVTFDAAGNGTAEFAKK